MSFPLDEMQRWMARVRAQQIPVQEVPSPSAVSVVSDFTSSQSAEPFECRALFAASFGVPLAGDSTKIQLTSQRRPAVVELLRVRLTGGPLDFRVSVGPGTFFAVGGPFVQSGLQIGGIIPVATLDAGQSAIAADLPNTQFIPLPNGVADVPNGLPFRCLVPLGSSFTGQIIGAGVGVDLTILWREIV